MLGGSFGTIHSEMKGVLSELEDVGNNAEGECSEVPDGLHSVIQLSDLPERGRLGTKA